MKVCHRLYHSASLRRPLVKVTRSSQSQSFVLGDNGFSHQFSASFSSRSFKHAKKTFFPLDSEQAKIEKENARWRNRAKKEMDLERGVGDDGLPPSLHVVCRRGKGQHLLKNDHIVEVVVDRAGIRDTDTVLEIGPGTGNLTLRLLQVASKVIAVEVDPRMVVELQRRVQHTVYADKLTLIRGDIMQMELPDFDICVANIPYKISSPLTFKLLSHASKFRSAVLMLQREFARRLMAAPGDPLFCRLSVNSQLLAHTDVLMEVSKANFSPPPKVDSSVVRISPRPWPPPVNLKEWNCFIRVCFSRKNKTLGAIFRQKHLLCKLAGSDNLEPSEEESSEESGDVAQSDVELCEGEHLGSEDEVSELESGGNEALSEEDVACYKEKVIRTLQDGGYENKRSVKLTQEDFVVLLESFNRAGVRFA